MFLKLLFFYLTEINNHAGKKLPKLTVSEVKIKKEKIVIFPFTCVEYIGSSMDEIYFKYIGK